MISTTVLVIFPPYKVEYNCIRNTVVGWLMYLTLSCYSKIHVTVSKVFYGVHHSKCYVIKLTQEYLIVHDITTTCP